MCWVLIVVLFQSVRALSVYAFYLVVLRISYDRAFTWVDWAWLPTACF